MDLHGKAALVTGGATRVGRAISLALARAGADVIVNYHTSAAEADVTAADVAGMGRRVMPYRADVAQADQVQGMMDAAVERFGRLDVLVNSASIWKGSPWPDVSEAEWELLHGVAAKGAFLCARAATPFLKANGDGAIVNITDLSALAPFPGFVSHSTAKAAVLSLTRALAIEMAPVVRVNAIAPGAVLPPPDFTPEQIALAANMNLLNRWGSAENIADAVVFLAQADFITGILLPVDGGEMLAWRKRIDF
jgi:NAD(P)-dependent dehydrogenase (short-subunit alcohol dehydrogenase family)